MSAVWLNALAPTQRSDLRADILDESDFTLSLMKSERGSFEWQFKEAEKSFVTGKFIPVNYLTCKCKISANAGNDKPR